MVIELFTNQPFMRLDGSVNAISVDSTVRPAPVEGQSPTFANKAMLFTSSDKFFRATIVVGCGKNLHFNKLSASVTYTAFSHV